ncbi:hypothetical protein OsI_22431 [Oryza sativa Indica Group]|uniref:Uncharacterized protein n=1 Tax=Oryza sativa subsp. indica TaxID=39946 RepID=B8B0B5_ORYSI|nr:hypothetical protein OsI_22431 [Oryza sativa Indica Group]
MHQVNLLTTGLGKPLSIDVELQNPADLQAAMSLARSYEQRLEDDAVAAPRIVENKQRSVLSFRSAPAPVPAPSRVGSSMSSSAAIVASKSPTRPGTTGTRFRRLSAAEMAECREKGLCFNCPEKFSKDHHRQCSMKGIYLLEMDEGEDDDSINDDTVTISLHALTGIRTSKTMRLAVIIGGVTMSALVDSGSTHTFVATEAARRLGLSPTTKSGLNVMVANGDQVTSSGICSGIPIKIDSEDFIIDCYVIPLEGYDVVLGVQWLRTLGPILWDFDKLTMSFWRDDHQRSLPQDHIIVLEKPSTIAATSTPDHSMPSENVQKKVHANGLDVAPVYKLMKTSKSGMFLLIKRILRFLIFGAANLYGLVVPASGNLYGLVYADDIFSVSVNRLAYEIFTTCKEET